MYEKKIIFMVTITITAVFMCTCGKSSVVLLSDMEESVSIASSDDSSEQNVFEPELDEITLELDGISREYNLLFLADNQANFDSREDLGWFGTKESRAFRDANGVASEDNLPKWIDYVNVSDVDAVVFGGDILDIYTEDNAAALHALLDELTMPYLYTYGNHDSYVPWKNTFEDDAESFLQLFPDGNCEFSCMDMGDFYIVSVRDYAQDGTANVSAEALESFREVYDEGKAIILSIHVPVAVDDLSEFVEEYWGGSYKLYDAGTGVTVFESIMLGEDCGYSLTAETREFLELLLAEDSSVQLILAGHLHISWSGQLDNGTPQYVAAGAYENKGAIITVKPAE